MLNMCRYLLAAIGIVESVHAIVRLAQHERLNRRFSTIRIDEDGRSQRAIFKARSLTAVGCALAALIVLGFRFQVLPGGSIVDEGDGAEYAWGPFETEASDKGFVDGWARWNFSGYEGRSAYGEYYGIVQTMKSIGEERGCGRALWENYGDNDKYGTTMALMLLPFWTDGCIGSSEGLFFEAAGTTPYHFLAAGAMSKQSSNPVRELRYVNNDASIGIDYLRALGIRYYLAVTPEAQREAAELVANDGGLTEIATSGPWKMYEVSGSDIVVPLDTEPVVVNGRGGDQRERWLEIGTSWLQNGSEWPTVPVDDGPDSWQRTDVEIDMTRRDGEPGSDSRKVDIVAPSESIEAIDLPDVSVTNVVIGEESVDFEVDRTGIPVLVRVSYFPNWRVSGGEGPYRVAPNMMVVIPTENQVSMDFRASWVDRFAYFLTLVGIVLVFVIARQNRIRRRNPQ
jgi:hypothetical protein